jgi:primosomal protein N' (replication factor Y)
MPPELLADVAVRAAIPDADPVFTYRIPPRLRALARAGQLVWAPLRRQRVQGIILDLYVSPRGDDPTPPLFRPDPDAPADPEAPVLRDLEDVADPEATLTPAQIRLARWLNSYYRVPLYEALALMLPPGVGQTAEPIWRATGDGLAVELGALPERERAILYFLRQHGPTTERDLRKALRGSDSDLREAYAALQERGMATRGAVISRARARPRIERLVRLRAASPALDAAIENLANAPKQAAVLAFLRDHRAMTNDQRPTTNDQPTNDEQPGALYGGHGVAASEAASFRGPSVAAPLAIRERQEPTIAEHDETQYGIRNTEYTTLSAIYAATGATRETLRALERKELIEIATREVRRDPLAGDAVPPDTPPPLTRAQERVWLPIAAALDASFEFSVLSSELNEQQLKTQNSKLKTFLLHGVTGSGKTEIYLRAIGRALRHGQQALVLVPEIALTAQLVRRFAARFPGKLAVLHSGLGLGERYDEWRRLRHGQAQLAIGSRSAVFAPLPNLGLIIVDEEHESSYKHDGAPRYHAREVARRLAEISGSVLILGSATPSVESYAHARAGELRLLELAQRVGMANDGHNMPRSIALPLPPVRIVDMRRELQQGNRSIFSRPLQQALATALERDEQAILFLTRRGAAAFVMCRDCGHVVACPNCSSPLVVHYEEGMGDGRWEMGVESPSPISHPPSPSLLVCHSCGHRELVPAHCPECWSPRIKSFGVGTQRVVEEVTALFPEARALRWDRDSVGRKGDHTRMLDRFLAHEADVLVGTQMIAKGLDLPLVSVVGVVAADTGLHLPDFRAGERTFQLLTQVAGRAGRRSAGAQVVIQTYTPDHYALLAAQEHDYQAFFSQEIAFRRQTSYPPFSRLVRFVYASASDERSRHAAEELAAKIQRLASALEQSADSTQRLGDWGIIGPAPAFFHRQRNRFRWHLLLRAQNPSPLLDALRIPPGWALDIDPTHVL